MPEAPGTSEVSGERLRECPFCGAELLPDEVTKTNEVVVWRHAHNACLLNGVLPGIRVPHDVEAWNRRSDTPVSVGEEADDEAGLAAAMAFVRKGITNAEISSFSEAGQLVREIIGGAIRAYLASADSGEGWKDISTAPKDGTRCLCYAPGNPKADNFNACQPQMRVDHSGPDWPRWRYALPEAPYTHWMHLPTPPVT